MKPNTTGVAPEPPLLDPTIIRGGDTGDRSDKSTTTGVEATGFFCAALAIAFVNVAVLVVFGLVTFCIAMAVLFMGLSVLCFRHVHKAATRQKAESLPVLRHEGLK